MASSNEKAVDGLPIRGMAGPMASVDKMMPHFSDITFWLVVNVVLFLYVGIFERSRGYGPGPGFSAGAIVLAFVYLLLWMYRRTNMKMADQWLMIISGLAILGDLIVVAWSNLGIFTGNSALLDMAGLMLFHSTYKEYRGAT